MKKIFLLMAAVCAVFASCSKGNGLSDNEPAQELKASDIKFDISVADLGVSTKAAKTGWVDGDKINVWLDDMDVMSLEGAGVGRAEITLTYDGTQWTGAFDEFYVTHTDESGKLDGLFYTINPSGVLNCLYEGSNNIGAYSVDISGYEYTFTAPSKDGAPVTPLVCFARSTYEYNNAAKTLSLSIGNWTVLTMIQVVVPGLDASHADNYTLSCNGLYNMSRIYINSESGDVYADGYDTESPTCGVANADGVAFCFYDKDENFDDPYTFTLTDGTDTWEYTVDKTLETSSEKVKFIRLPALTEPYKWD